MSEDLTDIQRQMMRHALGLDQSKNAYRNRYFCGTTAGVDAWVHLVARGFAVMQATGRFSVTRAGFALVVRSGETFDDETFDDEDAARREDGDDDV